MYNEPIPTVDGKFDIVLNSKCEPVAILTNSKVYQTTFDKVTAEHALKEGEGDLSLSYWRQAHERFFLKHIMFLNPICQLFVKNMNFYTKEINKQ